MEIQGTVPKLYPEPRIGPSIPLFIPASGDGRDFMIEEKKYEYQGSGEIDYSEWLSDSQKSKSSIADKLGLVLTK